MATTVQQPVPDVFGPLDRLRRAVVRFVLWDALAALGLGLAVWFWAGLLADYGLFKLAGVDWVDDAPRWVRGVVPVALVGVLAGVAVRVGRRLRGRISYPALALAVERRFPSELGDRVITAVELADTAAQERAGYSPGLLRQTVADAGERLRRVPVEQVLDWKRLRGRAVQAVVAAVVPLVGLVAAVGLTRTGAVTLPGTVLTVGQWAERNLLLRDVSWPRRAFVRLVGVPAGGLRIGRDAPPPKLVAEAFEWVTADRSVPGGWRPMVADDLRRFYAGLPVVDGSEPVDRVFDRPDFAVIREDLGEIAAHPWNARSLRRLAKPAAVELVYAGLPEAGRPAVTAGNLRLVRQSDGRFAGELAGLKESVRFRARADDFRTPPADLVLIPPPQLVRLARAELRPAYRLHPPPAGDPLALRGLQQALAERELSLTGDRSVLTVPRGTAVTLVGTTDKPLATVRLGRKGEPATSVPVDGAGFRVPLPGTAGGDRLTASAEFDLTLADADGVSTTRGLLVQVTDDQPPQVEVAFDVLRKVGPDYLCTAAARAPLGKDGIVRDDVGLARVRWVATATRQESAAAGGAALQLQGLAGGLVGGTLARGPRLTAELPVPAFDRLFDRLPRDTPATVRGRLATPAGDADPAAVREVRFSPDADAFDLLDLGAAFDRAAAGRPARPFRVTDPAEVQPRYRVDVQLVATDTDADTGPKDGTGTEAVRLLVVPEADLLAEITRDEDAQAGKLDEAIRRVREAETKLAQTLLPSDPSAEARLLARVRTDDIGQDVGKARDLTQGVLGEYARLRREVEANRCGLEPDETGRQVSKVARRYDAVVIRPLDGVLANEFVAADDGLGVVRDALAADRRPADAAMADARGRLAALGLKLAGIRAALGESLSEKKLRDELARVIARQAEVRSVLDGLKERMVRSLFAPKIAAGSPVEVARGQSVTVRLPIDWNVYDGGDLAVRLEYPPDGRLTGPASLTVKDDKTELEYSLTAGDRAGEFVVRLVPAVGEPVEVRVVVK